MSGRENLDEVSWEFVKYARSNGMDQMLKHVTVILKLFHNTLIVIII